MINLILYTETISCSKYDLTTKPQNQTTCILYLQQHKEKHTTVITQMQDEVFSLNLVLNP